MLKIKFHHAFSYKNRLLADFEENYFIGSKNENNAVRIYFFERLLKKSL